MRTFQYWILLLGSFFVSVLLIRQAFLTRDLNQVHDQLIENQETISRGAAFENAWKKLATRIYLVGKEDPALMELLKKENIGIHAESAPNTGSAPAPTHSAPPASSKTPVAPVNPTTP